MVDGSSHQQEITAPIVTYSRRKMKTEERVIDENLSGSKENVVLLKKRKITDYFAKAIKSEESATGSKQIITEQISTSSMQKTKAVQSYLIGESTVRHCEQCKLSFDSSCEEDLQRHRKVHAQWLAVMDGNNLAKHPSLRWRRMFASGAMIVTISGAFLSRQMNLAIDRINDEEMSAVKLENREHMDYTFYLHSKDRRIVGLLITQHKDSLVMVMRIWTDAAHRRKGIAASMIASIRSQSCMHDDYACCVDSCMCSTKDLVFTQPTNQGQQLALFLGITRFFY